ncbi:hypothetical protein BC477_16630 [Clavibacter michiganensis subsp. michiganensis]|uniref:Uncharacterized protein n=1 Tax=Clavibacter michiganensis subsp. michiganensis TaxID=33013 RepID=A0A251XE60_CLAMM|nr:hypothetical protein BC477_16630 [Clavibacter michiganensis subsp. michiganensis]OUE00466.1 hypothetical protein CMMCAS07_18870 [Clavibacter michiganensis subsp. michiganensis]
MTTLRDPGAGTRDASGRSSPQPVRVGVLMGHESALDEVCAILRRRLPRSTSW